MSAHDPRTLHSLLFSPPARPSRSLISPLGSAPGTSWWGARGWYGLLSAAVRNQNESREQRAATRRTTHLLVGKDEHRHVLELLLGQHRQQLGPRCRQAGDVRRVNDVDDGLNGRGWVWKAAAVSSTRAISEDRGRFVAPACWRSSTANRVCGGLGAVSDDPCSEAKMTIWRTLCSTGLRGGWQGGVGDRWESGSAQLRLTQAAPVKVGAGAHLRDPTPGT